ncbi:methyl-accepting chemotaxis protein [Halomonas sp. WWR20]
MTNLSVKKSLTLALAVLVLMIAAISGLGFYSNHISAKVVNELSEINFVQSNTINRTQVNLLRARVMLDKYATYIRQGQADAADKALQRARGALKQAEQRYNRFKQVPVSDDSRRDPYVDKIDSAYTAIVVDTLRPLMEKNDLDEVARQEERINELYLSFDAAVESFIHYVEERGDLLLAEDAQSSSVVEVIGIALLILALATAIVVRMGMIRTVVKPLDKAVEHFKQIAQGNLTAKIEDRGTNEMGQLFSALKEMQIKLSDLVRSLRSSSDSVFTGAGNIATGSQDLSSRTEEQASALQETASSMEQMASAVRQNTDSAMEADRLSASASEAAEAGGADVQRTVELMQAIATSSRKINEVVEVIDSIAFQTNILALNASVEAARAGEQGRGFAVVASEVRSLASRSAESAKEIRTMIESTTSQIISGAEQAERSGQTISRTVESIRQVSKLMKEISTATREQNSGIEQINVALVQMDSVTQQNASLVGQTSTAAASLEDQAKHLAELIAAFRTDDLSISTSVARGNTTVASNYRLSSPMASRKTAAKVEATQEWAEF